VFWKYNYKICLFLYQGRNYQYLLVLVPAGVVRAVLVVKRDNVTAAAMNSNAPFEYIVILLIQVLLIGFENATSGF